MPVTEIATDLLTPLGAYLSLREEAAGAFLLESVERGRLGTGLPDDADVAGVVYQLQVGNAGGLGYGYAHPGLVQHAKIAR